MDLIDTHQHLILREKLGYAWTAGVPVLQGDFTPEDHARVIAIGLAELTGSASGSVTSRISLQTSSIDMMPQAQTVSLTA